MPETTITIDGNQRGLYELIRNHPGSIEASGSP